MGYQRPKKVYVLKFEDPELDGLVIKVKSVAMGQMLDLPALGSQLKSAKDVDTTELQGLFKVFADALVEWNLEDDGQPIPCTYEAVMEQDPDFVMMIFTSWIEAVAAIPVPLGQPSRDGSQTQMALIPMETSSPSPAN